MLPACYELDREPAVSVGDRGLSYGELREAAAALAAQFEGAERVAVWAESTLETCVAVVAAVATGVPLVPVNPKLGRGELEHVLSDSQPDVIVGAPDDLPGARAGSTVDVDARGGELPGHRRRRRGSGAGHLHERDHRQAQGRDPAAARRHLQPRRPRRRVGLDRRGRAHPRPAAVPRPRARARAARPAAPRRRAAPPRPLRPRRRGESAAGRRDDAVRGPDHVPPARPRGRERLHHRRRPQAGPPAGLRVRAPARARVHPHRDSSRASRSSSATGSPRR